MNRAKLLETEAQEVLSHYPSLLRGNLIFLGNHGGFSGALIWRLEAATEIYCLKAWPAGWRSSRDLAWIHALMQQASAYAWIPRVLPTSQGETIVICQGRLWDITTWMPGSADFSQAPSAARLEAACFAVAQMHQSWVKEGAVLAVCPAIQRRWDSWQTWHALLKTGWRPAWKPLDLLTPAAEQLWQLLQRRIDDVPCRLAPWLSKPVAIQPCVCDLWHDHVLFRGDAVTGLIDFGSVKQDHVAVDLARLLGSFIASDAAMWEIGLSAYQRICPLSLQERELVRDLDVTGTILAATHWLRWLYQERRTYARLEAVRDRLVQLVQRLCEETK